MTNADMLLDVLGEIDEQHLDEIDRRISYIKKRKIISFVSMAAVFVILCTSVIPLIRLIPKSTDAEASNSVNTNLYTQDSLTPPENSDIDIKGNSTFGGLSEQESQFLYYVDSDGNIAYLDRETNQATVLLRDRNYTNYDIYADSKFLYLSNCSTGSSGSSEASDTKTDEVLVCYEIIQDENGKPYELKLVNEKKLR